MALSDSLISYWPLDEASGSALDAHGSNDLAESASDTIDSAAGHVGGARDFELADTEYFSIADNADLSTGDIDFTIAAWVNLESLGTRTIVSKFSTGASSREYTLQEVGTGASARLRFSVDSNGTAIDTAVNADTFGAVSTATWYFVVAWHDSVNNVIGISVNDISDTAAHSAGVFDGTAAFAIGARVNADGDYFDGIIDEVGFWKRVLTSAEITELYNAGAGRDYAYIAGAAPATNRRRRVLICGAAA